MSGAEVGVIEAFRQTPGGASHAQEAEAVLSSLRDRTTGAGLTLHPTKTRIVNATDAGFDFLGWHFRGGKKWPRKKNLQKLQERLLREIQSLMAVGAAEKGLRFTLELAADLPRSVSVDAGKLRQALLNLAGNAIKDTEAGRVTLRARLADSAQSERTHARFEVEDSGPGIGHEDCHDRACRHSGPRRPVRVRSAGRPSTGAPDPSHVPSRGSSQAESLTEAELRRRERDNLLLIRLPACAGSRRRISSRNSVKRRAANNWRSAVWSERRNCLPLLLTSA